MQVIQIVFKSMILGTSILGLAFVCGQQVRAESGMPPGYTLSKTQIKGKHCYRHGKETNLYCYSQKLNASSWMKHNSMMKKDNSMMKKDNSMMKPDSMMKKDDSMMMKK
jgi:hypothetical protein